MSTTIWTIRGYTLTRRSPTSFELHDRDGIGYELWIEDGAICSASFGQIWMPKDVRARTLSSIRRLTKVRDDVI